MPRCLTLAVIRCNWLNLLPACLATAHRMPAAAHSVFPATRATAVRAQASGPYMTENKPQVFGNGGRNDTNGITHRRRPDQQRDLGFCRGDYAES